MCENPESQLVSIIIPVYNRQHSIRDCLLSCVQQTYRPIEIILVDDGSVDDSRAVIHQFLDEFKATDGVSFEYLHQLNRGASVARNKGIDRARGAFLTFVDSDDTFPPKAIADRLQAFSDDVDVVFGDFIKINQHLNTERVISYTGFNDREPISLLARRSIVTGCLMFKKHCFDAIGFGESIKVAQDRELCVKLLVNGFTFRHIPIVVYHHMVGGTDRISDICWTEKNPYRYIHTYDTIVKHIEKCDPEIVRKSGFGISKTLWRSARTLIMEGKRKEAYYYFNRAVTINGGNIPQSKSYRFFAAIISVNNVELLKSLYIKFKSSFRES